jgi:adenylate cyclase
MRHARTRNAVGKRQSDKSPKVCSSCVHTGRVWMGAIGEGSHVELTAVGDAVNVTARLASAATAGEILVSVEAALAAGLDPALERRSLELKGKQLPTDVVSLRVGADQVRAV